MFQKGPYLKGGDGSERPLPEHHDKLAARHVQALLCSSRGHQQPPAGGLHAMGGGTGRGNR